RRHARPRASIPNRRAELAPTGTNNRGSSLAIAAGIKAVVQARKRRFAPLHLPLSRISRITPLRMADLDDTGTGQGDGPVYRVAGALTITRSATTQREIDGVPDPLTIDLSEVNRMDTVGAWIVYRTVRDRGAKVIGASRDEVSLLKQGAQLD